MKVIIKSNDVQELVSNYRPVGLRAVAAAYVPKRSGPQSNKQDDRGAIKVIIPSDVWTGDTD